MSQLHLATPTTSLSDATADQEDVLETDLAAPRRALIGRFRMLPNPFLKRPSESQAHAYQSHEADFDWR